MLLTQHVLLYKGILIVKFDPFSFREKRSYPSILYWDGFKGIATVPVTLQTTISSTQKQKYITQKYTFTLLLRPMWSSHNKIEHTENQGNCKYKLVQERCSYYARHIVYIHHQMKQNNNLFVVIQMPHSSSNIRALYRNQHLNNL